MKGFLVNGKFRSIFNSLKIINFNDNLTELEKCDVLFFCSDANRGLQLNHRAYSPLMDSLREEFEKRGYKCISIANPFSILTGEKAYGNSLAMNKSFFIAEIKRRLLAKFFLRKHGINPLLNLYGNIFQQARPKLIITINCNDFLCAAARRAGIYHLELLHGIGYSPIPWSWDKKGKQFLPQGIISLDDVSTKTFLVLEQKGVSIFQIPHPFLSRFALGNLVNLPEEWKIANKQKKYKKEILISLQWGYAGDHGHKQHFQDILNNGLFFDELAEVIQLTRNEIFWRFRFHPVHYRNLNKYQFLFDFINNFIESRENCEWKESTYLPLPSVLAQCDGNITMNSMTSYEAAYMGIKTLALCPIIRERGLHADMFTDLVDKGYMLKQPPNIESILYWVRMVEKSEPLLGNLTDKYWFERLLKALPLMKG